MHVRVAVPLTGGQNLKGEHNYGILVTQAIVKALDDLTWTVALPWIEPGVEPTTITLKGNLIEHNCKCEDWCPHTAGLAAALSGPTKPGFWDGK